MAPRLEELTQVYTGLEQLEAQGLELCGAPVGAAFDAFRTAVVEIATNILRHAYPPGHAAAPVVFDLALYRDRLEARFHDSGVAFTPPARLGLPKLDDLDELPEGGFGLYLAVSALDHLTYSRMPAGVNAWHLVKRLN